MGFAFAKQGFSFWAINVGRGRGVHVKADDSRWSQFEPLESRTRAAGYYMYRYLPL
jgi:hypothetical protein